MTKTIHPHPIHTFSTQSKPSRQRVKELMNSEPFKPLIQKQTPT